jgi:hypothetical protein
LRNKNVVVTDYVAPTLKERNFKVSVAVGVTKSLKNINVELSNGNTQNIVLSKLLENCLKRDQADACRCTIEGL